MSFSPNKTLSCESFPEVAALSLLGISVAYFICFTLYHCVFVYSFHQPPFFIPTVETPIQNVRAPEPVLRDALLREAEEAKTVLKILGEDVHDTISSSIHNANDVPKRAVNVLLGFLSMLGVAFLFIEFISRALTADKDPRNSVSQMAFYIIETIVWVFLALIAIFPGGAAGRNATIVRGEQHVCDWNAVHSIVTAIALAGLSVMNIVYVSSLFSQQSRNFITFLAFTCLLFCCL